MQIEKENFASRDPILRRYLWVCAAIVGLCLILKLPNLKYPRIEDDELIYWSLTRNWLDTGAYTLQGHVILQSLPPGIYDKPFFHHPPLLPMLLAPFVATSSPNAAILISWLGHIFAVMGVAIIAWTWRRRRWHATNMALWLPVLGIAMDPIMSFCARKLWTDALVGGLACLTVGLHCLAAHRRSVRWALLGGAVLGLAGLAKIPGLLVMPVCLATVALAPRAHLARRGSLVIASLLPAALVLLPWFVKFHAHYGVLLPDWIQPDTTLRAMSSHVERAVGRRWHYYLAQSVFTTPLVLVLVIGYVRRMRLIAAPRLAFPLVWVTIVLASLLVLGLRGQGMQIRFLTPASPGFYAMLAGLLGRADPRRSLLPLAAMLSIVFAAAAIGYFLYPDNLRLDDIVSLPEIVWRMWTDRR